MSMNIHHHTMPYITTTPNANNSTRRTSLQREYDAERGQSQSQSQRRFGGDSRSTPTTPTTSEFDSPTIQQRVYRPVVEEHPLLSPGVGRRSFSSFDNGLDVGEREREERRRSTSSSSTPNLANVNAHVNASNNTNAFLLPPSFQFTSHHHQQPRRSSTGSTTLSASACSSARSSRSNTPFPSRSTSPLPEFASNPGITIGIGGIGIGRESSSCASSDTDDDDDMEDDEPSPLLRPHHRYHYPSSPHQRRTNHHSHHHSHHHHSHHNTLSSSSLSSASGLTTPASSPKWWNRFSTTTTTASSSLSAPGSRRGSRDASPTRYYSSMSANLGPLSMTRNGRSWWNIADMNVPGIHISSVTGSGGNASAGFSNSSSSRRSFRRTASSRSSFFRRTKHVLRRWTRRIIRHPFFPRQPITIVLSLLLLSIFAVSLTLLIIHILNPDKAPLPWRAYCSLPTTSASFLSSQLEQLSIVDASSSSLWSEEEKGKEGGGGSQGILALPHSQYTGVLPYSPSPPSPPLESLPPVGLFIGVFSMDSSFERRMLVRTTWASHSRSRDGAGQGDNGRGTSRTIVRFIMGQPRKAWERRVKLEMEMYGDIVVLPVLENMNGGKTYTFFSWAALDAWVPPVYADYLGEHEYASGEEEQVELLKTTYGNLSAVPPRILAPHDPSWAWRDREDAHHAHHGGKKREARMWVRPDYVIKVDDDSFVMLAELEARLRVELYAGVSATTKNDTSEHAHVLQSHQPQDPLIYWGYLVKNRYNTFMAGELYALSWALTDWVSKSATVKGLTKGAEDKQTAKWMKAYSGGTGPGAGVGEEKAPRREVRWVSERCWVYDHPRSGTVYAHGFLFPSEVARVKAKLKSFFDFSSPKRSESSSSSSTSTSSSPNQDSERSIDMDDLTVPHPQPFSAAFTNLTSSLGSTTPASWAYSTVSTFGQRYTPPLPDLTITQSVEALVEGSAMSLLREGSPMSPSHAWIHREGRTRQYEGKRTGGTVVVHFIKKNMWFVETALVMLEGEEESESERVLRGVGRMREEEIREREREVVSGEEAEEEGRERMFGAQRLQQQQQEEEEVEKTLKELAESTTPTAVLSDVVEEVPRKMKSVRRKRDYQHELDGVVDRHDDQLWRAAHTRRAKRAGHA